MGFWLHTESGIYRFRQLWGSIPGSVFPYSICEFPIVYTLVTVPAQMLLGLLTALFINSINHFRIGFRVLYYLPVITSWVIASLVFKYVFNTEGMLNYFLTDIIHVTSRNIRWLDTRWGGLTIAMLLGIWKGIGWEYGGISGRAADSATGTV